MLKGIYIDSALQMITGGDISDESAVWRDDIEALLPAAVNYALVGGLFDESNQEHDRDIPGSFVGVFEGVSVDRTGAHPQFVLPKTMVPLSSDRGLRLVTTIAGDHVYNKMNDNFFAGWHYYKNILKERMYKLFGTSCRLFNIPDLEEAVTVYMIVSTEDYLDTEHLPVPAGKEVIVIEQLFKMFSRQRLERDDKIEDKTDIN